MNRAALAITAAICLLLAVVGLPPLPVTDVRQDALQVATDASPYSAYKGGAYACNALDQYPNLTDQQVTAWLVDSRHYSTHDAVALVVLAHTHGC